MNFYECECSVIESYRTRPILDAHDYNAECIERWYQLGNLTFAERMKLHRRNEGLEKQALIKAERRRMNEQ